MPELEKKKLKRLVASMSDDPEVYGEGKNVFGRFH
jgi:hypothetical protein